MGSGTFFLERRPPPWPDFQLALGKRLDLQPKPFAAPGFLLVACEAQRVRVVVGQALVEMYLTLFRYFGTCGAMQNVSRPCALAS